MTSDRPQDHPPKDHPHSTEATVTRDWNAYYKAVSGRPPRETVVLALNKFDAEPSNTPRFAIDLGCGDGRDTVEILRRGWRVLGIDGEADALNHLKNRPDVDLTRLETRIDRFENLTLNESVDLINASFCLPFCPPNRFNHLWQTITSALNPGGRFSGHLFGDRDSWAVNPLMSHFTRAQLEELLAPFEVELLDEEDHPGKTALGEEKHWHIYNLVLRKPNY